MDLVLVRVVSVTEVHVAAHGAANKKWITVLEMFTAAREARRTSPLVTWYRRRHARCMSVLKAFVKTRRKLARQLQASSGIAEEHDELATFLDELITDIDHKEEKEKQERNAEELKKKELREAGSPFAQQQSSAAPTKQTSMTHPTPNHLLQEEEGKARSPQS
eukprot:IDg8366t1